MINRIIVFIVIFSIFVFVIVAGSLRLQTPRVYLDPYSGVLVVRTDTSQGSCFVVAQRDEWHYAITAAHVTEMTTFVMVDDELYEAEIVKVDTDEDVALIRFKSPEVYRIYSFAKAELGEPCVTVGWSRGNKLAYKGYIVSLDFDGCIAANGGVVPGCSGGVLLNKNNEAIGITVTMPVYRGWVFDSTALYVPARYAEALLVAIGE